ncbi:flagellar brake protein [Rhodoferax saidenbachensis]|uniref:Flagellar brake protein n=1 Tax=Rhodoferax saidenbachensis TaxID=1484693 RepID=A0A1P8KCI8_9BURK|nr:flagellar brake protein [Rhodoferax saidenbachensis]APW43732.1 flagellar brake protein [Rhodoferax saidenbachensis]
MNSQVATRDDQDSDASNDSLNGNTTKPESSGASQDTFPFDAMNLKVGDRLQAQVPANVSTERCSVRLIGFMPGLSILVTAPVAADGTRLQLMEKDVLIMRVFSSQNAFGFACDIQRVCKLPYNYLHLSFPKEVQGTVIRKSARVRAKIIAKVFLERAADTELAGIISNLSANGALLDARRNTAEVGDVMRLNFRLKLHNIETTLTLRAAVRAVIEDEALKQSGTTLAHFGLEFVDMQPNDQMLLQSMVYQKMIEQPQSLV